MRQSIDPDVRPSVHTLGQETGREWDQGVLGVQLVIQLPHPPRQLLLLHLGVARLHCIGCIVETLDQDLLGQEPLKEISRSLKKQNLVETCSVARIQTQRSQHGGAAAIVGDI